MSIKIIRITSFKKDLTKYFLHEREVRFYKLKKRSKVKNVENINEIFS